MAFSLAVAVEMFDRPCELIDMLKYTRCQVDMAACSVDIMPGGQARKRPVSVGEMRYENVSALMMITRCTRRRMEAMKSA